MSAPAPLSSTHFNSLPDFQRYFQAHDELCIAANQHLVIRQIPAFALEGLGETAVQRLISVINRILFPFARSALPDFLGKDYPLSLKITSHSLASRLPIPWKIKLESKSTPLLTRIDHLFQMMVFSSVHNLKIAPSQALVLTKLTKDEIEQLSANGLGPSLLERHVPPGFTHVWESAAGALKYTLKQDQIELTSTESSEISLTKPYYFETPEAFLAEVAAKGRLVIRDHEFVKIHYPFLQSALKDYETFLDGCNYLSKLDFLFNHMLLFMGKGVSIQLPVGATFSTLENELTIGLTQGGAITFSLKEKQLVFSNKDIQKRLLLYSHRVDQDQTAEMFFLPKHVLTLYGFKQAELAKLVAQGISAEELRERLEHLFFMHSALAGSSLCFSTFNSVKVMVDNLKKGNEEHSTLLRIQGDGEFSLALSRIANPQEIALQVINLAHPQLLADLLEGEFNAMAQLFFLVLFHCCCEAKEWSDDEERAFLEGLFKAETIQKIRALKQNEAFKAAYREIQADPVLKTALDQILQFTPEEFGELDLSKLKPALRQIIGDLKNLEHAEFQGGLFLGSVIQTLVSVLNDMDSPLVQNLLLHPHPKAAAAAPAEEEHKGAGK